MCETCTHIQANPSIRFIRSVIDGLIPTWLPTAVLALVGVYLFLALVVYAVLRDERDPEPRLVSARIALTWPRLFAAPVRN